MFKALRIGKVSAVFLAASLLCSQPAYGFEVSYEGGDKDFSVEGSTGVEKAGQIITLKVTDGSGNLIWAKQTETDADGAYGFLFAVDYNGDITATVSEDGTLISKTMYKSTDDEVSGALARLSGTEPIGTVIREESKVLQIDISEYTQAAASGLLDSFLDAKSYGSVGEFQTAYKQGLFLAAVEKADTAAQVYEAESTYPEAANAADTPLSDIYSNYDEAAKLEVLNSLCGERFESIEAFALARDKAVVIREIANAPNYNAKYQIIKDNNNVLGMDLEKYESLGSKFEDFKERLFQKEASDAAELIELAEKAYEKVNDDKKSGGSGGGGGGGGGSNTSSVKVDNNFIPQTQPEPMKTFTDIDGYEWAKTAITVLSAKGIINGKADGIFAPADNVTRAEFVKMLSAAFSLSGTTDKEFWDVPAGHWAHPYVQAAVASKIAMGISDYEFGANNNITRQDMAVFCSRIMEMLEIEPEGEEVAFTDEGKISAYAVDSIKKLAMAGIINGFGDGTFAPFNNATRAEAAVIIYKLSEYCSGR